MSTRTTVCIDAIEHLPEGATLVVPQVSWDDYERLVEELHEEGMHVRVSYDRSLNKPANRSDLPVGRGDV